MEIYKGFTKIDVSTADHSFGDSPARALYIGSTGDVAVEDLEGNSTVFNSVPAGTILPINVSKVLTSGTVASNIIGLE